MSRRRHMSRRHSRKYFSKHSRTHWRNVHANPMRGGIRF